MTSPAAEALLSMRGKTLNVRLTAEDISFVYLAVEHYELFAEASERQGESRSAGIFRGQEFHAEQFKGRIEDAARIAEGEG